jgi:hypothetical protein
MDRDTPPAELMATAKHPTSRVALYPQRRP